VLVLGGQLVQRLQLAKQLRGMRAHRLGLLRIHAVTARGCQHALPALMLELLVSRRPRVFFGVHLRQDAVPQPIGE